MFLGLCRAFSLVRTSCTVPPDSFLHLTASDGVHCTGGAIKIGSFPIDNDEVRIFFFVFSPRGRCVGIFILRAFLEVDFSCCSSTETCILPVVSLVRTSLQCTQIVCDDSFHRNPWGRVQKRCTWSLAFLSVHEDTNRWFNILSSVERQTSFSKVLRGDTAPNTL